MNIKNRIVILIIWSVSSLFVNELSAQTVEGQLQKVSLPVAGKNTSPIKEYYKYSELRAYELTLANGVHVVVRADEGRKDVLMKAVCPGGASLSGDQDFVSAMHAGAIIGSSGFGDVNGAEVSKFFQQKNISLTPGIKEKFSFLEGSFSGDDLEAYLQAITLYFTSPRKDKAYFSSYMDSLQHGLVKEKKNPYKLFQDTVDALSTLNKNRVNTLSAAKIKQIKLDKAYEAYRRCFGNAYGYTFVFTGHFKVDAHNSPAHETLDLMARYLGALPSTLDSQKVIDRNAGIPPGKIFKKLSLRHVPLAAVQMIYSGNYQHSDSVNLQLKVLTYLLGKNLDTLAAFSGENKASVKLTLNKYPSETYAVAIAFKCPAAQSEAMVDMVHQTIADLQRGIKSEQRKQYVALRKQELKSQTFDYVFWRDYLATQFMNHDDPYEIVHYPYNFYKATDQSLQQAANEFLTDANYIQAILLPRKK